jgi:hypothetical protein
LSARDRLVNRLSIIGAVSRDTRNLRVDPLEQDWRLASIEIVAGQHAGDEFAGLAVKSEMQFAPGPSGPAMLLLILLTLTKQFQSGAVDHQVHRTMRHRMRPMPGELPAAPA